MRVGMLADLYKPHLSGVTNYISLNKRALEALGHKVFVFTLGNLDHEDDELHVIRSPAIPLSDTGVNVGFRYSRVAQRKLVSMDVLHVHHPFISGHLAIRYGRRRGLPIVFTNHTRYDLYSHFYLPLMPDALSRSIMESYLPRFCAQCDLTIAPSRGIERILREMGVKGEVAVIPNGIDLKPFASPKAVQPRARFAAPDETLLLYVGRLGPEKNLAFLIRAFAGARAACGHARLLVVGDGPELDNLRDRVARSGLSDCVHFAGRVPYEEVPGYMAIADALVTASVTEVHPLSLIEAMASGLPLLGIRSPGVEDIIVDGENGLLCGDDIAAYTALMVRLLLDAELRRRLADGARRASQAYAIERTSAQVLAHYVRLMEAGGRRRTRGFRAQAQRLFAWGRRPFDGLRAGPSTGSEQGA